MTHPEFVRLPDGVARKAYRRHLVRHATRRARAVGDRLDVRWVCVAHQLRPVSAPATVPLLILSGSVGVGKTTVGSAISGILAAAEIPHAFVDRDALSSSWPPVGRFNEEIGYRNLTDVWRNFRDAGATRLILSGVMETRDDVERCRSAVPGAAIALCRLQASRATREARIRAREGGASREWHLARTVELEEILEGAELEDFRVQNDGRPANVVAREVLARAGWHPPSAERDP